MAQEPRINGRIRAQTVRFIDENGVQVGIVPIEQALERSRIAELDLVEVAPNAEPPVCRIMDYGKYKYEIKKRLMEGKKKAHQVKVKEIRLRPKTDEHDFMTKVDHARSFLEHHHKVLVNLMFRGREMQHIDLGRALILRFATELEELAKVEQMPRMEGRRMTLLMAPK